MPLSLEGGEAWRSENSYAVGWANPAEVDRAPIVAAHWRICRPDGTACVTGSQPGAGVARLAGLRAPAEGEWDLRVVRQDAAGNRNDSYASPPVRLRLDSSAPTLSFQSAAVTDPTQVAVAVNDKISAVAGGQIELSREGSNVWQALPTRLEGGRLVARIDDAALPAGRYLLRGQARDLAGNVGVAAAPSAITLPLRIQSSDAGRGGGDRGRAQEGRQGQEAPHGAPAGDRAAPQCPGALRRCRDHRRPADQPRRPATGGPGGPGARQRP